MYVYGAFTGGAFSVKNKNTIDYGTLPFSVGVNDECASNGARVQMETASTKEGHSSADVFLVGKGRCVMVSPST